MEIKCLCKNPWLSLYKMTDKKAHVDGYVYSHETRCNGQIVVVVPFRKTPQLEFLVRMETTPCWGMEPELSSVTGGVEEKENRVGDAVS